MQPQPASGAQRVADGTVRIVGTVEEHCVGFDERLGQRQGGGRVLRHQLALDLPEPGLEFATEPARLRVTHEFGRLPPPRQGLAESRCQRLGLIRPLQPHEPIVHSDMIFGEFEQDRGQGRGILLADEDLQGLGGGFAGHEQTLSARCGRVGVDPNVDRARDDGYAAHHPDRVDADCVGWQSRAPRPTRS